MFGSCALAKSSILLIASILMSWIVFSFPALAKAQSQPQRQSQKQQQKQTQKKSQKAQIGVVVSDGALVYQAPDFDSKVIARLQRGKPYRVSSLTQGPFYQIIIPEQKIRGWIADTDIRTRDQVEKAEEAQQKYLESQPFYASRFRGFVFQMVQFSEKTLGKNQSEWMPFYGFKMNGFNTLISGDIYMESNILFSLNAPTYFSEQAGVSAQGFSLLGDLSLQTVKPLGKSWLYFYGVGPLIRFTHLDLKLANAPGGQINKSYSSDELGVGAVFNLGFAVRISKVSLRLDAKYHWERSQYPSVGLGIGYLF